MNNATREFSIDSSCESLPPEEVIRFLESPSSYLHRPQQVQIIQTHASIVAVASPYVYKVKKSVNLGFLDYSTLESRRFYCEREVELNQRLASGIYLGITPIVRSPHDGQLMFSETGKAVEYAVTMRQIPDEALLKNRLAKGRISRSNMAEIGKLLGSFYRLQQADSQIALFGSPENIRYSIDQNYEQTEQFINNAISAAAFKAIRAHNDQFFKLHANTLEQRASEGRIRECHGDLHLEHIAFLPDGIRIFDCIEFNDRFRCIDTSCDIAFLAMDLEFNKRFDLAQTFADTVFAETSDNDYSTLNFYKCYRAYIRGKVAALRSISTTIPENERSLSLTAAKKYFRLALHYALSQSRSLAIFVMGKPASGKSSLAQHIAAETGWKYCSSDITRKELAGVNLYDRGSAEERKKLYAASMTELTYSAMEKELASCGAAGRQIVIDATFGRKDMRLRFRKAAEKSGMSYRFLVVRADEKEVAERLKRREKNTHSISDARLEDYYAITEAFEEPDELNDKQKIELQCAGSQREFCGDVLVKLVISGFE